MQYNIVNQGAVFKSICCYILLPALRWLSGGRRTKITRVTTSTKCDAYG